MIELTIIDKDFQAKMDQFIRKSDKDFKRVVLDSTNQLIKRAKLNIRNQTMNSKIKSGNLIRGIRPSIFNNGLTGEVTSKASYSEAYESGTRPHGIRVRNKRVLAGPLRGAPPGWGVGKSSRAMGFATYGKRVQHPGTRAHPFMEPAWRYAVDYFDKQLAAIFK